jgi:hypothetical protein
MSGLAPDLFPTNPIPETEMKKAIFCGRHPIGLTKKIIA